MKRWFLLSFIFGLSALGYSVSAAQTQNPDILLFFEAARSDSDVAEAALDEIATSWRDGYTPFIVNTARMFSPTSSRTHNDSLRSTASREQGRGHLWHPIGTQLGNLNFREDDLAGLENGFQR